MNQALRTEFKGISGSFESCFIFEEKSRQGALRRKVKIYNKVLDLFQSESVMKPISMCTNELFSPGDWLRSSLLEAVDRGLTRIEISYYADDALAESLFFHKEFEQRARNDIQEVKVTLNDYKQLTFSLSVADLLHTFEYHAKQRQLFILQRNVCAMIYAKNPLRGNYTGYLYNIPAKKRFDYEDFLAKNALPGPGSNVHCILEADKDESKR